MLKRVMRHYRFVVLCSLGAVLGFGACSLDPVPVLPSHEDGAARDATTSDPNVPASTSGGGVVAPTVTTGGTTTTGGSPGTNETSTTGSTMDPDAMPPTDDMEGTDGDAGFPGASGEGGAAGETGDTSI